MVLNKKLDATLRVKWDKIPPDLGSVSYRSVHRSSSPSVTREMACRMAELFMIVILLSLTIPFLVDFLSKLKGIFGTIISPLSAETLIFLNGSVKSSSLSGVVGAWHDYHLFSLASSLEFSIQN